MRRSAVVLALVLVALAVVCARLGVWQVARWHEKRALAFARAAALAEAPLPLDDPLATDPAPLLDRVLEVRGRWDTARVVRLTGRTHEGAPGLELARPLVTHDGIVMVERGWVPAEDGVHAEASDARDTGVVLVRGVATRMRRGAGGFAPESLADTPGVLTARWLDADSLAVVLRAPVAAFALRERPDPTAPRFPVRLDPEPIDPRMHLSYAVQWFAFALVALAAALVVLRRGATRP